MTPRLSVVVPYFERPDQLDRLLAGLDAQTLDAGTFEVVVADDGSRVSPVTGEHAYGVRVVRQEDLGFRAAAARNLGARHAAGEVLVFLDQDCVPGPAYLATVLPAVSTPWSVVLGHRRHADLSGWTGDQVRSWLGGVLAPPTLLAEPQWLLDGYARTAALTQPDPRAYQLVISAVLSLPRGLLLRLGGFDESFERYGGEDWELGHRLLVAGADLRWLDDAVVWHDGPDLAGRSADLVATKNAETLALAALVPDRDVRGEHLVWDVPDVVVTMRAGGATVPSLVASIESLLAGSDAHVWVDDETLGAALMAVVADPRIHVGQPPRTTLARARYVVACAPVLLVGTTLRDLCAGAPIEGDGFRLTSVRDDNRAARGVASPASRTLPSSAQVTRLVAEPTLERLWQGRTAGTTSPG